MRATAVKQLDQTLDEQLLRFARKRGGPFWLKQATGEYRGGANMQLDDVELQLAIPWALFHYPSSSDRAPMAQLMREEQANRLSPDLLDLLDSQLEAWLSVWEVQEVKPGVGVELLDLLTGAARFVHEVRGSRGLLARHALLGRVVSCNGVSFLGGLHPRPLPPQQADHVVREMRRICQVRTKPVSSEKLRDAGIQLALIDGWRDALVALDRPQPMPVLHNTDGDLLALTTDHFEFDVVNRGDVMERLSRITGAGEPVHDNGETEITLTKLGNAKMKSWDNTIIGRIVVCDARLSAESNSTRRADALRALIEMSLGNLAMHRLREETSPAQLLNAAESMPAGGRTAKREAIPPELRAAARQMKEKHMLGWIDDEIPALGGLTPRQAAASPDSRAKLDLLLRDIEHHEARLLSDERFDVGRLRVALGLEPGLAK